MYFIFDNTITRIVTKHELIFKIYIYNTSYQTTFVIAPKNWTIIRLFDQHLDKATYNWLWFNNALSMYIPKGQTLSMRFIYSKSKCQNYRKLPMCNINSSPLVILSFVPRLIRVRNANSTVWLPVIILSLIKYLCNFTSCNLFKGRSLYLVFEWAWQRILLSIVTYSRGIQ